MTKTKLIDFNLNHADLLPLPSDEHLEKMVLGILIDVPDLIEQMYKYLQVKGVFYDPMNDKIWECMKTLQSQKMTPTKKNIVGYFKRLGDKDTETAAAAMSIHAGEISMIKQYCLKLFETAIQRNVIRIGHYLNTKGNQREDPLSLLAVASNGIGKMYEAIAGMKAKTITDGVNELTAELAQIASSPDGMLGIKGSVRQLNHILKGYRKGNMIVIGASSGEGKTTFAIQELSEIVRNGKSAGFVSLEMTQSELLLKIACERLSLPIDRALDGTLNDHEFKMLGQTLDQIAKWNIHISETPGLKIGEVKATARMWRNRNKIDILFIDHLHLIRGDINYGNAEQQFTDIANQIKELSKELDIPVIALAQLARKETNEKRMHIMTDLKYAGGIEQAADVVILIFRPEHHGITSTSEGESTEGKAVIKVDKLRLLRPGSVKCNFDGLRFTQSDLQQTTFRKIETPKAAGNFDDGFEEAAPF